MCAVVSGQSEFWMFETQPLFPFFTLFCFLNWITFTHFSELRLFWNHHVGGGQYQHSNWADTSHKCFCIAYTQVFITCSENQFLLSSWQQT